MIQEAEERIAYRFSLKELAALIKLMGAPNLPDLAVTAAPPDEETVQSLIESGIVMVCGERIFVDRAVSLIVNNVAENKRRLTVKGDRQQIIVLFCGPQICVFAYKNGDLITLEPVQNTLLARDRLFDAAGRIDGKLRIQAFSQDDTPGEGEGLEGLAALYEKIKEE